MTAIQSVLDTLTRDSIAKAIDPISGVPLDQVPDPALPWMPEALVSLHGTPEFAALSPDQRRQLSQLEFSLVCSISCSGEKEVIANIARLMLKKRFEKVRPYLYHFVKEENNHIYVFAEFVARYGKMYPSLYAYAQGELWDDDALRDLMTFVHVLVFEELGHGLNEIMAKTEGIPPLVRAINSYHVEDEGRHISFGRHLVKELASELVASRPPDAVNKLRDHVIRFVNTRHIDYHNMHIYKAVGVPNAFQVRDRLVSTRDVRFFIKNGRTQARVKSLLAFLVKVGLIVGHPLLEEAAVV